MNDDEYNKIINLIEPMPSIQINKDYIEDLHTSLIISIAISLKSIANALEKQNETN